MNTATSVVPSVEEGTITKPQAIIEAKGLVKVYPGGVKALDGLTFSLNRGTILALVGPNGAGKSTTMRILTTLAKPDQGSVEIAGVDALSDYQQVRKMIGYVGQKSGLDPEMTGRENLMLQGCLYGLRGGRLKARVEELLELFSLSEAADKLAGTYSGGMQRKLDISTGLVHRPELLLMDEPTTGLDPMARSLLWAEIRKLSRQGMSILFTTHYLEEADQLAENVAVVDRGKVVAVGTPEELKSQLRGDRIEIELSSSTQSALSTLRTVSTIREATADNSVIYARADNGASAVPAILTYLESQGHHVVSVRIARTSLDDVYFSHTGRTFKQAEEPK